MEIVVGILWGTITLALMKLEPSQDVSWWMLSGLLCSAYVLGVSRGREGKDG